MHVVQFASFWVVRKSMPSSRPCFLLRRRVLLTLFQKDQYLLLKLFFRPLFDNCYANVRLFTDFTSPHPIRRLLIYSLLDHCSSSPEPSIGFHCTESDRFTCYIFQDIGFQFPVAAVEFIHIVRGTLSIFLTFYFFTPNIQYLSSTCDSRSKSRVTVPLVALFFLENPTVIVRLVIVVPGYDLACDTFPTWPPQFPYGPTLLTSSVILTLYL